MATIDEIDRGQPRPPTWATTRIVASTAGVDAAEMRAGIDAA